jgi:hypothetical protein
MTEIKEFGLTVPDHVKKSSDRLIKRNASRTRNVTNTNIANRVIVATFTPLSLCRSCLMSLVTGQLDTSEMFS